MQTNFTPAQLADPKIAEANTILRKCVHCGFCTATCPTYVLLGDELDSPRGRIYQIKEMLENDRPADAETVKHVDRCLSCLSCMTTCPSGVNYMHLVDQARAHIEKTYDRPVGDRLMRWLLNFVMTRPQVFRFALIGARASRSLAPLMGAFGFKRLQAMVSLAPRHLPRPLPASEPQQKLARRVALLKGCVQSVLDPEINAATVRLLNRLGVEVIEPHVPCCGSLSHHMGKEDDGLRHARATVDAFAALDVEAIVISASGCGTTIKDYGYMLAHDALYADKAKTVAAKALDVTEFLSRLDLTTGRGQGNVTYHSACSMQHGQGIKTIPQKLLRSAGFTVSDVADGHLCCGSAGSYNMLQPEIATRLRDLKIGNIARTNPDIIATGNIGCMSQLRPVANVPIVHTIELLDWAYGGPRPTKLDQPLV
jgi:glycolate oxidase iron-sulfur subunit